MKRVFLELVYFGKEFHGWQRQKNALTVQEEIEKALAILLKKEVSVMGCGRTDSGVHATEFFAHCDLPKETEWTKFIHSLNGILPNSIAIKSIYKMPENAHARFDAVSRTYHYWLHQGKNPFLMDRSYKIFRSLHVSTLNQLSLDLVGKQDFTSFSKLHTQVKTNICQVQSVNWSQKGENEWVFTITADRFLRGMVRAIVGSILSIDEGKSNMNLGQIISAKNREVAGFNVPAKGLYLAKIKYPKNYLNSVLA